MTDICRICKQSGTNDLEGDFFHKDDDGFFYHRGCYQEHSIFLGVLNYAKDHPGFIHPDYGYITTAFTWDKYVQLSKYKIRSGIDGTK